jgi:hypothetical protein
MTVTPLPKPELLNGRHVIDGFDCDEPDINRFLCQDALRDAEAGFSRTWVIAKPEDRTVMGFVSLSASSQAVKVKVQGKSTKLVSGILATCPYPTAPVVLIGQLGRRKDLAKTGIGGRLLTYAIMKAVETSSHIGVAGIVLDAMTDNLLGYYRKAKFERLPHPDQRTRRMLLTMVDANATIASLSE